MSEQDDRAWLSSLSGKDEDLPDRPANREARLLRAALLERSRDEPTAMPPDERERQAQLIKLARREGLLAERSRPAADPIPKRQRPRTAVLRLALAAGLAGLAIATAWQWLPSRHAEIVRGASDSGVVHLRAANPKPLKEQIIRELGAAGVKATGYESLDAQGIDADLPQPVPPGVADVLRKYGIPTPTDGSLRVEIRAP
jgi:hypothetical protein